MTPGQLLEEFIRSLLSDFRSAIRGVSYPILTPGQLLEEFIRPS